MKRVMQLPDMQAVQEEAVRSMAHAARDAVLGQSTGLLAHMSVEVRDDDGPVMRVRFSFEIDRCNA